MYDITDFQIVAPYTLWVQFDDGVEQVINFEPALYGYYHEPLRDLVLFNQVQLDPDTCNLVWPNGADFDPADLHNWDTLLEGFKAWAGAPVGITP